MKKNRPIDAEIRNPGRPNIFSYGLTPDDLVEQYNKHGSCRKAAKALGISDRALRKHLRSLGFSFDTRPPCSGPGLKECNSGNIPYLLAWVEAHPKVRLPRSFAGIAKKTTLREASIRTYLMRRARRVKRYLLSLGTLVGKEGLIITDDSGRHVPTELIDTLELNVDVFDLAAKLTMRLKYGGILYAKMPWAEYAALFGATEADTPWAKRRLQVKTEKKD